MKRKAIGLMMSVVLVLSMLAGCKGETSGEPEETGKQENVQKVQDDTEQGEDQKKETNSNEADPNGDGSDS